MTLNISLISRTTMAQSSDLRLTDVLTGSLVEDESPKQISITYFTWRAVIGYSGVAQLDGLRTHEWLANLLVHPLDQQEPQLADVVELIRHKASIALSTVRREYRRHTFVILAFNAKKPIAFMISNYQRFNGRDENSAADELFVSSYRPGRDILKLAGVGFVVSRTDKRLLKSLLRANLSDDALGRVLAGVNRRVWEQCGPDGPVSEGCVTYVLHADDTDSSVTRAKIRISLMPINLRFGQNITQQLLNLLNQGVIPLPRSTALVERTTSNDDWNADSRLTVSRMSHTATKLVNGDVLVVGGRNASIVYSSTEMYSTQLPSWKLLAGMANERHSHQAIILSDGRVLVIGGMRANLGSLEILNSCEIYNPAINQWSEAAALKVGRYNHTSTLLQDGRVLVVGGHNGVGSLMDVEVYNLADNTWEVLESLNMRRNGHTATLLPDGRVLIVGGTDNNADNTIQHHTAEISDIKGTHWTMTTQMAYPHSSHTATLLNTGHVLVVGTQGQRIAELYDPDRERWNTTSQLNVERQSGHTAILLNDGSVLIAGGMGPDNAFLVTVERYFTKEDKWEFFTDLSMDRCTHTATLLDDGSVLIVGGATINGS